MPRRSAISVFRIAATLFVTFTAVAVERSCYAQAGAENRGDLGRLQQSLAAGDLVAATETARHALKHLPDDREQAAAWAIPLARLARKLQQDGEFGSASEFYKQSLRLASEAQSLDGAKVTSIRLLAAREMLRTGELEAALETVEPVFSAEEPLLAVEPDSKEARIAIEIVMKIGASALVAGQAEVAEQAYGLAMNHASPIHHALAMLGHGWAAVRGTEFGLAADRLAAFVDRYPEHPDAAGAVGTCLVCLQKSHREFSIDSIPAPIADWLLESAAADRTDTLDLQNMTSVAMHLAAERRDSTAWLHLLHHLSSADQSGQATSDLLASLVRAGRESDAERLAASLIAPTDQLSVEPLACESACRWAGRTQRWSMLAMAAEGVDVDAVDSDRTVAVERLFAEALLQTGRARESLVWWNYLVDDRAETGFATLIRCAELETAVGIDASAAEKRIAAAREAAEDDRYRISLVDLLDAELAIRRLQFDRARSLLENVVRSDECDRQLQGRAQWLIGETHFLQRDYASAIDAYRRVEGISPEGPWASAALVQAGKSFEQLGRTREAAVCYGILLGRFSETAHAAVARRRLAAISPENHPATEHSDDAIIRR